MYKDLNIKISGLSNNESLKVVEELKRIISSFSFLDFRRFSNIIVSSNLQRDVEILSSKKRQIFKNRYSCNKKIYAEVLTIPKNDDFEIVLVIQSNFVKSITKRNDKQEYKNAFHVIHHELAHIHDNNKKIDVFKELIKTKSYKGRDSFTYPLAEMCWSEYIANFISSKSALETDYPKLVAKNLIEKINRVKVDTRTNLSVYKSNKNRGDLIEESISKIEDLIKTACYLLGYLNGIGITLEELDEKIDLELGTSYFKDFWEVLKYDLASIHQLYPNAFVNLNIYKNLAYYIETFYSQMGIILDENEKGKIQIHIM